MTEEHSTDTVKPWREVSAEYPADKGAPYDEIDPAIVELCKAINEFPGIVTTESCQGLIDGHKPDRPWFVLWQFHDEPTMEGLASTEFLVWQQREARAAGFDVFVGVNAPPPWLNGICQSMYFFIECSTGHPDDFAKFLRAIRDEDFAVPIVAEGQ